LVPNEDTQDLPLEDCASADEIQNLIGLPTAKFFSEHQTSNFNRQVLRIPAEEPCHRARLHSGFSEVEAFRRLVVETNSNYRWLKFASNGYWVAPLTIKTKKLPVY